MQLQLRVNVGEEAARSAHHLSHLGLEGAGGGSRGWAAAPPPLHGAPAAPSQAQHSHIRMLCMLFYYKLRFSISRPVTAGPRVALTVVRMGLGDIMDGCRAAQGRGHHEMLVMKNVKLEPSALMGRTVLGSRPSRAHPTPAPLPSPAQGPGAPEAGLLCSGAAGGSSAGKHRWPRGTQK